MSAFLATDVYGVGGRFTVLTTSGTVDIDLSAGGGGGGGVPAPDGTLALPQGFNFTNELGLGFYRLAAGMIGVTGNLATRAIDATGGGTLHQSPTLSMFATAWDGAASQLVEWGFESEPLSDTEGSLNIFLRTTLGTFVSARLTNDSATPGVDFDLFDGRVRCAELFSTFHLDSVINGGNLAQRLDVPAAANDTAIQQLLMKDGAGAFTSKDVEQAPADSAGTGFAALRVPNDAADDTSVATGDFALTGWGTGATFTVRANSTCRHGQLTVTAGTGSSAAWTITLTFPVAFAVQPDAVIQQAEFVPGVGHNGISDPRITTISTTTLVATGTGDDGGLATNTYTFTWMVLA